MVSGPAFHVQNVFDVLSPIGVGVNGYLKLKCLQVQNRVVGLANPGDIIAVSDDCSPAFLTYMLDILGAKDVTVLRYRVSRNLRRYLNAYSTFESLVEDPKWKTVRRRRPRFEPYIQSPAIYRAARGSGLHIPQSTWDTMVIDRIADKMNDKAVLHQECQSLGVPVPEHWIVDGKDLVSTATALLGNGIESLYIRQTRSGGAFGNITVKRNNGRFITPELGPTALDRDGLVQALQAYVQSNAWHQFVISRTLDLYASPGTLFYAGDKEVSIVCHSYQVLTQDRRFLGFYYPIKDENIHVHFKAMEHAVYELVEPWRQRGYRGYGNIDWMITKTGGYFIAERNARETATVPALNIADVISGAERIGTRVVSPPLSVFTQDRMYLETPFTFEEVYERLRKNGLLWGQSSNAGGVVISAPPSPAFGIYSIGIVVLGIDTENLIKTYRAATRVLGAKESKLLFKVSF